MDFQTQQEKAKTKTWWLVLLLIGGLLAIILITALIFSAFFYFSTGTLNPLSAFVFATPVVTTVVGGTSLVKSAQLKSGGGSHVASSLGGRQIDFTTGDKQERRLTNIVEEIAIASGLAVPEVFVLDNEPSINAFAAGWNQDNAAIGVTRGALNHLNRSELQGVIAHEFSHIRNGDTKIKTKVIGAIFGIMAISFIGRLFLEQARWANYRSRDNNNFGIILAFGALALMAVGFIGSLFAKAVQAGLSRQREYLADASAVQYTREPEGLGTALQKIAGMEDSNKLISAHGTETSHLFFSSPFSQVLNTHPPIGKRIKQLLPSWDGTYIAPTITNEQIELHNTHIGLEDIPFAGPMILGGLTNTDTLGTRDLATHYQGNSEPNFKGPTQDHINYAQSVLVQIPNELINVLHTPLGAVSSIVGLLVSDDPKIRTEHIQYASRLVQINPSEIEMGANRFATLDRLFYLPAVDIALRAIRSLPNDSKISLADAIEKIESTRTDQDLFRWVLRRVVLRHLRYERNDVPNRKLVNIDERRNQVLTLLNVVATLGTNDRTQIGNALSAATNILGWATEPLLDVSGVTYLDLDIILQDLQDLDNISKQYLIGAVHHAVAYDQLIEPGESEIIRVIADAVGLPVPPLIG